MLLTLCGKKLQFKNGKNEAIEQENAQRLPGSAFDRHKAEIRQSEEEIKVNYRVDWNNYRNVLFHKNFSFPFAFETFVGSLSSTVMEELLIELLSNGRGRLDYARNIAKNFDDPAEPDDPSAGEEDLLELCICGNCVSMENPQEQRCCTICKCITSYKLFQNLFLDRNVLEVAIKARCDMRADDLDFSTNSFRKAVYRQYILWRYGRLGKGHDRRVCPPA